MTAKAALQKRLQRAELLTAEIRDRLAPRERCTNYNNGGHEYLKRSFKYSPEDYEELSEGEESDE